MPEPEIAHPSLRDLLSFSQNELDQEAMRAVEQHLSDCAICRQNLSSAATETVNSLTERTSSECDANQGTDRTESTGASPPADSEPKAEKLDNAEPNSAPGQSVLGKSRPPSSSDSPEEPETIGVADVTVPLEEFVAGIPAELSQHVRYKPLALLGQGGMGSVYKAEHLVMGRIVALKVIRPELSRPDLVERFRREIRAAAKLSHPNIVTAYDAEQAGGMHFLVVEYVDGDSFDKVVADEGCLSVGRACELIRQAAIGLHHAFEQGMVHRDLKPQNLMVTDKGIVKVLDFGLAKVYTDNSVSGSLTGGGVMGTPDYMAPEQADNPRDADTRADIYSLCCTLYFLLRGEPPFPHGSVVQKLMAHLEKEPPSISEFRSDVPPALCRLLAKGMAKNPAERFAEPLELAQALTPFADANDTHVSLISTTTAKSKPISVPVAKLATESGGATHAEEEVLDAIIQTPDDLASVKPPAAVPMATFANLPAGESQKISFHRKQEEEKPAHRETAGIIALCLGLFTLLFAWIPCAGYVALPFSLLGVGLAVFALVMAWGDPQRRRKVAVAGIVVCCISVAASVTSIFWLSWLTK